ncbi:MAG: OmpA family protein [Shimia sp.]
MPLATPARFLLSAVLVLGVAACARFVPDDAGTALTGPGGAIDPLAQAGPAPNTPAFFQQNVGDRVLFEVDQSSLTDAAKATLDGQAGWLQRNADYQAIVEGHADEQGTTEYNIALSARRANSVREYLVAQGVAGTRLRTVPFGKERPAELCAEERCYRANRRAVTVIAGGGLPTS